MQKDKLLGLISSHLDGDDERFRSIVLMAAADATKSGHASLAAALKSALEGRRRHARAVRLSPEAQGLLGASDPSVTMRDMVLPPGAAEVVSRVVSEQRGAAAILERGMRPANRLLFYGPPGSGKTSCAEALAHSIDLPIVWVKLSAVSSRYLGETAARLAVVFEEAARVRAVYLLDEFDSIACSRDRDNDVGEAQRVTNCLLQMLSAESTRSVFVAATNRAASLDRAVFRRFDYCAEFCVPTGGMAARMVSSRMPWMPEADVASASSAATSLGLSLADVSAACEAAARWSVTSGEPTSLGQLLFELRARPRPQPSEPSAAAGGRPQDLGRGQP